MTFVPTCVNACRTHKAGSVANMTQSIMCSLLPIFLVGPWKSVSSFTLSKKYYKQDLLEEMLEKEKRHRKSTTPTSTLDTASSSADAQNRFANAKSISSDMFFDRDASQSNGNAAAASEKFANR